MAKILRMKADGTLIRKSTDGKLAGATGCECNACPICIDDCTPQSATVTFSDLVYCSNCIQDNGVAGTGRAVQLVSGTIDGTFCLDWQGYQTPPFQDPYCLWSTVVTTAISFDEYVGATGGGLPLLCTDPANYLATLVDLHIELQVQKNPIGGAISSRLLAYLPLNDVGFSVTLFSGFRTGGTNYQCADGSSFSLDNLIDDFITFTCAPEPGLGFYAAHDGTSVITLNLAGC